MKHRLLFLILIAVAGTGVLMSLGNWQLNRLSWKQAILQDIENRIHETPVELPVELDPQSDEYLAVTFQADLTQEYLRVLGGLKNIGAVHKIIAPVDLCDRRILVDLGYVKIDDAVDIDLAGTVRIIGNTHWPEETDNYTPAPDPKTNLWFARNVDLMAKHFGTEPVLIVAKDIHPAISGITQLPVDTAGIPNDHLHYAITWFSLAAVWAAMSALFYGRTRQKGK